MSLAVASAMAIRTAVVVMTPGGRRSGLFLRFSRMLSAQSRMSLGVLGPPAAMAYGGASLPLRWGGRVGSTSRSSSGVWRLCVVDEGVRTRGELVARSPQFDTRGCRWWPLPW